MWAYMLMPIDQSLLSPCYEQLTSAVATYSIFSAHLWAYEVKEKYKQMLISVHVFSLVFW